MDAQGHLVDCGLGLFVTLWTVDSTFLKTTWMWTGTLKTLWSGLPQVNVLGPAQRFKLYRVFAQTKVEYGLPFLPARALLALDEFFRTVVRVFVGQRFSTGFNHHKVRYFIHFMSPLFQQRYLQWRFIARQFPPNALGPVSLPQRHVVALPWFDEAAQYPFYNNPSETYDQLLRESLVDEADRRAHHNYDRWHPGPRLYPITPLPTPLMDPGVPRVLQRAGWLLYFYQYPPNQDLFLALEGTYGRPRALEDLHLTLTQSMTTSEFCDLVGFFVDVTKKINTFLGLTPSRTSGVHEVA